MVEDLLLNLPGGQVGFLIFVNAFVFVLAFFLDFFEIAFIASRSWRCRAEARHRSGLVRRHARVNMQTSFMHPPFGFALFYLRSVAPTDLMSIACRASAWNR